MALRSAGATAPAGGDGAALSADAVAAVERLTALAEQAAGVLGLPLTIVDTGHAGLERALADLVGEPVEPI